MINKEFSIGKFKINRDSETVVIAEAAVEHLGSLNVAIRMADAAKEIGVDIIKYQMHIPSAEMLSDKIKFWGGSLDDILQNYNLSVSDHEKLIKHCNNIGIQYLCTPFCAEAVKVLDDLGVVGFKTGSGELGNFELMKAISETGKPVIVSTGMSTMEEIKATIDYLNSLNVEFMLTNCTSIYPSPYSSLNLKLIDVLSKKFNVWVGHSDHTPDIWSCLGAVGMGAKVIEKHFTLNKFMNGPDSEVSLEPSDMKEMVNGIRIIDESKGTGIKEIQKQEVEVRNWAHHSIVSIMDIQEGDILTREKINVKRPGTGIPAAQYESVIGAKALKFIPKDSMLSWSDISQ
jgi:N-acetylneuraminate synthase